MNNCYIGRGLLSVSVLDSDRGFFPLSGESEVSLVFEEDNESVFDGRNGVNERVDWFVRGYRARVEAQCFRIEPNAIALLLKTDTVAVDSGSEAVALPSSVTVGNEYQLKPNLTSGTTVIDALSATVDTADYVLDKEFGTIKFLDVSGYTQPFTVGMVWDAYTSLPLHGADQILVKAMFKGVNAVTGQKILAHFYRLAVDLSDTFKMIQQGFSPLLVRLQATPDYSQDADPALGAYGRIVLL